MAITRKFPVNVKSNTTIEMDAWQWPPKPGAKIREVEVSMDAYDQTNYVVMHSPVQPYESAMALMDQISDMAADMVRNSNCMPTKCEVGLKTITRDVIYELMGAGVTQPNQNPLTSGLKVTRLNTAVGPIDIHISRNPQQADDITLSTNGARRMPVGFQPVQRVWEYAGVFQNEEGARIEVKADPISNMIAYRPMSKPDQIWDFMSMTELMAWGFAPAAPGK